jgi:hypothetical protein
MNSQKRLPALIVTALGIASLLAAAALAHHSPAVFDRTRMITIEGVVTAFSWSNPHSWIHLDVTDENDVVSNWTVEMNPATILARGGWRRNTLQAGDEISVIVYPLRENEPGGQFISLTLPDGSTMGEVPAVLGDAPQR